jgi:hypothetical protein
MLIGRDFRPEVGYARRTDFRRTFGSARFSPRPKNSKRVRKLTWQGVLDYVTDAPGSPCRTARRGGRSASSFSRATAAVRSHARLRAAAQRSRSRRGSSSRGRLRLSNHARRVHLGQQRRMSGTIAASSGTLYNGTKSEVTFSGRWGVHPRFSMEPGITIDWVSLPYGDFTADVLTSRFTLTPSARMLISSLVQYNALANSLSASAACAGSTPAAANCSSSTATDATR